MEVHALKQRGWSISAIARHLGRDRKTVRAYLSGERITGERAPGESDPFESFEAYVRQRLSDDPHVWVSALFDEVVALGYSQSYPTFVRKIRHRGLRPLCGACAGTRGRATAIIDHPPGEECQTLLFIPNREGLGASVDMWWRVGGCGVVLFRVWRGGWDGLGGLRTPG